MCFLISNEADLSHFDVSLPSAHTHNTFHLIQRQRKVFRSYLPYKNPFSRRAKTIQRFPISLITSHLFLIKTHPPPSPPSIQCWKGPRHNIVFGGRVGGDQAFIGKRCLQYSTLALPNDFSSFKRNRFPIFFC